MDDKRSINYRQESKLEVFFWHFDQQKIIGVNLHSK